MINCELIVTSHQYPAVTYILIQSVDLNNCKQDSSLLSDVNKNQYFDDILRFYKTSAMPEFCLVFFCGELTKQLMLTLFVT